MDSSTSQNRIAINVSGGHISGKILTPEDYADERFITIPFSRFACIDLVIVSSPSERRRGKGSQLVRRFVAEAKECGANAVLAEIVNDQGPVTVKHRRAFFESLGFKVVRVNEDEHDNPPPLMITEI